MRIVFCGTPDFAVPALQHLAAQPDVRIEAVVTQPDRPSGRGREVHPSLVKEAALAAGLHVYQPEKIKSDSAYDFFERLAPDAVVIIAYGQIIPARLIAIPHFGWINLHASLLPKYRGAAPIAWAIAEGETRTGLTTMQIDPGLDTGPTLLAAELDIGPDETAPELARRMAALGAPLVAETLRKLERGELHPVPQDHSQATFAPMLKKEHGRIDWQKSARYIYNRIRAFQPWPGAYTTFRGQLCHIWGCPAPPAGAGLAATTAEPGSILLAANQLYVVCGENSWLRLDEVQLEGRKRLPAASFAHGARLSASDRFG
jgi:methionyl-tRNA formyltransferase